MIKYQIINRQSIYKLFKWHFVRRSSAIKYTILTLIILVGSQKLSLSALPLSIYALYRLITIADCPPSIRKLELASLLIVLLIPWISCLYAHHSLGIFSIYQSLRFYLPLLLNLFIVYLVRSLCIASKPHSLEALWTQLENLLSTLFHMIVTVYLVSNAFHQDFFIGKYVTAVRFWFPLMEILPILSLSSFIKGRYLCVLTYSFLIGLTGSKSLVVLAIVGFFVYAFSSTFSKYFRPSLNFHSSSNICYLKMFFWAATYTLIMLYPTYQRFDHFASNGDPARATQAILSIKTTKKLQVQLTGIPPGYQHSIGYAELFMNSTSNNKITRSHNNQLFEADPQQRLQNNLRYDIENIFNMIIVRFGWISSPLLFLYIILLPCTTPSQVLIVATGISVLGMSTSLIDTYSFGLIYIGLTSLSLLCLQPFSKHQAI